MDRDAVDLGLTLDEFTAEVNRESSITYTSQQTEPFWSKGHSPGQARIALSKVIDKLPE